MSAIVLILIVIGLAVATAPVLRWRIRRDRTRQTRAALESLQRSIRTLADSYKVMVPAMQRASAVFAGLAATYESAAASPLVGPVQSTEQAQR